MNLKEFNSLVDLFFYKAERENPNADFLEWLNPKNNKKYTWGETLTSIQKLGKVLKDNLSEGDRCLLVSENRPEWLIVDIAIMLSNAITVPAYTTYTDNDYKYLIEDCEPSIIVVSNNEMHTKLKKVIEEKDFINNVVYKTQNGKVNEYFTCEDAKRNSVPKSPMQFMYEEGFIKRTMQECGEFEIKHYFGMEKYMKRTLDILLETPYYKESLRQVSLYFPVLNSMFKEHQQRNFANE